MGKLAEIKTKETNANVEDFINALPNEQVRKDAFTVVKLMEAATKDKAKLWGTSIIGFGNKRFKSPKTDREVDWFKIGFAPRKSNITLYVNLGLNAKEREEILKKLGKYKTTGGCIYINKLADVDMKVLEKLIKTSVANVSSK